MKETNKLAAITQRELDIMKALWNSSSPMTASEIADSLPNMTTNIVQAFLRGLLKKDLIVIDKIVYSNTVLCRSFRPVFTQEDYILAKFSYDYEMIGRNIPKSFLVSALLNSDFDNKKQQEDLTHLKKILTDYKKKLKDEPK